MAQWLRALTVLLEDPGSELTPTTSDSRYPLLDSITPVHKLKHTHTHTHTHTRLNILDFLHVCMYTTHVPDAPGGEKRASAPPELVLQVTGSISPVLVLGTELGSSGREASALNH